MTKYFKLVFMISLFLQGVDFAQADSYPDQVGEKLAVGSSNIALSWLEVPKNILVTSHQYNILMGISAGTIKGVLHMMGRTFCGAFDLVTFPIPSESIVNPAYVYQNFKVETRYGPVPF